MYFTVGRPDLGNAENDSKTLIASDAEDAIVKIKSKFTDRDVSIHHVHYVIELDY